MKPTMQPEVRRIKATWRWKSTTTLREGQEVDSWRVLRLDGGRSLVAHDRLVVCTARARHPAVSYITSLISDFTLPHHWEVGGTLRIEEQLRMQRRWLRYRPAPNPWETAWFGVEVSTDGESGIFLILKTDGIELAAFSPGKRDGLFEAPAPKFQLGRDYRVEMMRNHKMIEVRVDGYIVAHCQTALLPPWIFGRRVGLYVKDAKALFGTIWTGGDE